MDNQEPQPEPSPDVVTPEVVEARRYAPRSRESWELSDPEPQAPEEEELVEVVPDAEAAERLAQEDAEDQFRDIRREVYKRRGRRHGPNRQTVLIKHMAEHALRMAGGTEWLARMATSRCPSDRAVFGGIIKQLIPKNLRVGDGNGAGIMLVVNTGVPASPEKNGNVLPMIEVKAS